MAEVERTLIFGPPGTGKTHTLIEKIKHEIDVNKIDPKKIVYITFNKDLADKGAERIKNDTGFELEFAGTMHALGVKILGLDTNTRLLKGKKWGEFKTWSKRWISQNFDEVHYEEGYVESKNEYLKILNYSRQKEISIIEAIIELDKQHNPRLEPSLIEQLETDLETFKEKKEMFEFVDMIKHVVLSKNESKIPNIDVIFLDEAQDLTPLLWKMFFYLEKRCKKSYIAGDDDQSLYDFLGADPSIFINLEGKKEYLKKSRRVPRLIHEQASLILKNISEREEKYWGPKEEEGKFFTDILIEEIDFSKEEWMILGCTNDLIKNAEDILRQRGFRFKSKNYEFKNDEKAYNIWTKLKNEEFISEKDAKFLYKNYLRVGKGHVERGAKKLIGVGEIDIYTLQAEHGLVFKGEWEGLNFSDEAKDALKSFIKKGEDLTQEPRIEVCTVHRAKGRECQNVVLYMDYGTEKQGVGLVRKYSEYPDRVHRRFYVGTTRAKENLYILRNLTNYYYTIGEQIAT